jgi:hypothetical protein
MCQNNFAKKILILFGNISCFALTLECERSFLIGLAKRLVLMRKSPGTAKFMNTLSIVKHVIKFLRGIRELGRAPHMLIRSMRLILIMLVRSPRIRTDSYIVLKIYK